MNALKTLTPAQQAAPELLEELRKAHVIILTALNIMTPKQQAKLGERLRAAEVIDEGGTTRYHERAAVIAKATGSASC